LEAKKLSFQKTIIDPEARISFQILEDGVPLTFEAVFRKWQNDEQFQRSYTQWILSLGFDKLYWEHPPLRETDLSKPYECVVIKNKIKRDLQPDQNSFSSFFKKDGTTVSFPNLGRDAQLVVPSPNKQEDDFAHLAVFLRTAPEKLANSFWAKVATAYLQEIKLGKRWLSTCGMGVYWLHVRIDQYPKYYKHGPYRNQ